MTIGTYTAGSASSLTLSPQRIYTLLNDDDTDSIYITVGFGVTPDGSDGENKFIITPGVSVDIGPGENILNFAASAGTPRLLISSVVAEASVLAACGVS